MTTAKSLNTGMLSNASLSTRPTTIRCSSPGWEGFLVSKNIGENTPGILMHKMAQVYFAVTTRAHEIHQLRMEQEQRLETRPKVSESFKLRAETAQGAGVLSENFGIFVDAGYLGLHHHTVEELKTLKSIPEREEQDLHTLACS